jgi:hypothetical protein
MPPKSIDTKASRKHAQTEAQRLILHSRMVDAHMPRTRALPTPEPVTPHGAPQPARRVIAEGLPRGCVQATVIGDIDFETHVRLILRLLQGKKSYR